MNVSLFLAKRLRLKSEKSGRSRAAFAVPVYGVALSMVIMLLTLAIVRGFRNEITRKIIGFDGQVMISRLDGELTGQQPIEKSSQLEETIRSAAPEASISYTVSVAGMLKTDDNFAAVYFRGYEPEDSRWDFVRSIMAEGELPDYSLEDNRNTIIISRQTARELKLKQGDKIPVYFFSNGNLRMRNYLIGGIFDSNFDDYDRAFAFASTDALRSVAALDPNMADHIELSGLSRDRIARAALDIDRLLARQYAAMAITDAYVVRSVLETNALYFNWLDLLDTNVVVILTLMSAISIFTLISSLFILILERVNTIGTLKAIGATNSLIRRTFILMAAKIYVRGLIAGNVVGLGLIALQSITRLVKLNPESYYVSYVPVEISGGDILLLNAAAIAVGLLVMIVPSRIISRMQPSKILRFA